MATDRDLALVTGGAGFIGSHLVRLLLRSGYRVRVLDNLSAGQRSRLDAVADAIEFLEDDIRDSEALARAVAGAGVVFHLAAETSVPASVADPQRCNEVNIDGTVNVLAAAAVAGVERVIFASSAAVYGDAAESPQHERLTPDPLSPYAASKLAGEGFANDFSRDSGLCTVSLRYFNVFGPGQSPSGGYAAAIPAFLGDLRAGRRPTVYGDGQQTRDFVPVREVARANLLAAHARRSVIDRAVINIATGTPTSISTLLAAIDKAAGTALPEPEFAPARPGDVRHSVGNPSEALRRLGFRVEVTLAEALAELTRSPAA